ncbi:hypothetical protein UP17_16285 [Peribacillus simplex]|uniref:hypothetical protein n=1 Tax=Peribacillus simplex TaxID=1478 RepID=UPI000777860A|nr:hypothetical protein [Peribacillus simplex]AMM93842.1 hypothetical protein UP17_16285 [Peribacillus simplex]
MKTATHINTWQEDWQNFYEEELKKTLSDSHINLLNYTNENTGVIFSKLDELIKIFPAITEANDAMNKLLDVDDVEYQSLSFNMEINEHIQLVLEPIDNPADIMSFECVVECEGKTLSFYFTEGDDDFTIHVE